MTVRGSSQESKALSPELQAELLAGRLLPAGFPSQVKVTNLVIWRGAIPHPPLRIAEKFPQSEFRMWERILGHLPRLGIQASNHVHAVGVVPNIALSINT